jgi:hypothetical protein
MGMKAQVWLVKLQYGNWGLQYTYGEGKRAAPKPRRNRETGEWSGASITRPGGLCTNGALRYYGFRGPEGRGPWPVKLTITVQKSKMKKVVKAKRAATRTRKRPRARD